jgi:PTH1 family peptidyl-tRNA hydrolase
MVLDEVARALAVEYSREKFGGLFAEARHGGAKVLLLKPLTFMNNSGSAVARAAKNKVRDAGDLLVVVDDVSLPLARLRFRAGGSAGGHKGLRSVIEHLGTSEFPRLRIGVGMGEHRDDLTDHVLGPFAPDERAQIERAVSEAAEGVLVFVSEGTEIAMSRFNARPEQ